MYLHVDSTVYHLHVIPVMQHHSFELVLNVMDHVNSEVTPAEHSQVY